MSNFFLQTCLHATYIRHIWILEIIKLCPILSNTCILHVLVFDVTLMNLQLQGMYSEFE